METVGTLLATQHWWGEHVGLVVGNDPEGRTLVAHCSRRIGRVAIEPLEGFSDGKLASARQVTSRLHPSEVVSRALDAQGRPYSFWSYNCEDFVSWVLGDPPRSRQREELYQAARVAGVVIAVGLSFGR